MSLTCITYLLFLLPTLILLLKLGNKRLGRNYNLPSPPSPPKLPFIGNLHLLGPLLHRSFRALSDKYGPLMLLQLGQVKVLVVSSPEMAEEIMKTQDLVFADRPNLKNANIVFRKGYDVAIASYGEQWRQARKHLVTHLLSLKMVQSFQCVREQEVQVLINTISHKSSSGSLVNMSEVLNFFSLDTVCRVVYDKYENEAKKKVMCEIVERGNNLLGGYNSADFFPVIGLAVNLGLDTKAKKNAEMMDVCLEEMMKNHASQSEKDGPRKQTNFMDALVSLEKRSSNNIEFPFTKECIIGLLVDVFAAGVDTSYIVLEWSMTELIRNPKSMKKLQDEVRSVCSGNTNLIREGDLRSMNFLKAVINESMRLHPPGPLLLPREAREDCQIAGYHIPKGTRVIINAWAIARDPEIWGEPEDFRPERFLDSDIDFKGNNFEYLPFGAGRRICPGMNFSMHTVELALANLVRMFDWELPEDMKIEDLDMEEAPGTTVRRKNSLKLYANRFAFE